MRSDGPLRAGGAEIRGEGTLTVQEELVVDPAEAGVGSAVQGLAVVRMGDGYEGLGTLREILVPEIDAAIFSYYVLGLETCRHDTGTRSEGRNDLPTPLRSTGRHRYERLAALGKGCAIHEVMLAADGTEYHLTYAVSADLAGQVDLYGRIDSNRIRILTDQERIVGDTYVIEYAVLVVVQELVHLGGTQSQGSHAAAWLDLLAGIIDDSRLHEAKYAVSHSLGMETKVLMVRKSVQSCVRDAANTDL